MVENCHSIIFICFSTGPEDLVAITSYYAIYVDKQHLEVLKAT